MHRLVACLGRFGRVRAMDGSWSYRFTRYDYNNYNLSVITCDVFSDDLCVFSAYIWNLLPVINWFYHIFIYSRWHLINLLRNLQLFSFLCNMIVFKLPLHPTYVRDWGQLNHLSVVSLTHTLQPSRQLVDYISVCIWSVISTRQSVGPFWYYSYYNLIVNMFYLHSFLLYAHGLM